MIEPRLIGTWHLMSYELRNAKGEVRYPMGPDAQGQLIYDNFGNMSAHLLNPHPPERPRDVQDGAAYEVLISYSRYVSYFGGYDINVEKKDVRHHLVGALMPGWAGTTMVRRYAFDGDDKLTLSADTGAEDEYAVLEWKRAK